jgi:hypothetical protein
MGMLGDNLTIFQLGRYAGHLRDAAVRTGKYALASMRHLLSQ